MGLATEQLSKQLLEYEKKVSAVSGFYAPLVCANASTPIDKFLMSITLNTGFLSLILEEITY